MSTMFLGVASIAVAASAQAGDSQNNSSQKSRAKILPWIEINIPQYTMEKWWPIAARTRPRAKFIDYCIEGLEHWAQVTDTAIVTTKPGQIMALYPELMERKPKNLFIIGGLKTYIRPGTSPEDPRPYDFADSAGWRRIAAEARKIVRITGTNVIVLENETALTPYHAGKQKIDYDKLAGSLGALRETGIQFWWNLPIILEDTPEFPDRQAQTTLFLRTVADALPDSVFIEGYTMWPDWEKNRKGEVDRRRRMIRLLGSQRIQERLIVNADGYWHYTDFKKRSYTAAEGLEMMPKLSGNVVNVYPGGNDWVEVAKQFEALLAAPKDRPAGGG
ncbi:MAG: hypothetical protein IID43_05690 [Planctomycetes bacterium]|nr:hypothetical protein [Planctomycetota bacterium]